MDFLRRKGGVAVVAVLGLLGVVFATMTTAPAFAGTAGNASTAGTPHGLRSAELAGDGSWCWFQDPRAVHYVGQHDRTYVGFGTSVGDIDVIAQDTTTGQVQQTVLHPRLQADDHAAPGLEILPDGRIAVFYSAHGGLHMYYRVSVAPEDVTTFGAELEIPPADDGRTGGTYANPFYLTAEKRTYLFFRGQDFHTKVTWSSDLVHWSTPAQVTTPHLNSATTRPYVKYATNGTDTVMLSFTDGHPRDVRANSVYSLVFRGGVLSAPDGTALSVLDDTDPQAQAVVAHRPAMPHGPVLVDDLSGSAMRAHGTVVYDGSGSDGQAWTVSESMDASGLPVMLFATYADKANAQYQYARFVDGQWRVTHLAGGGGTIAPGTVEDQYIGGGDIDRNDPTTMYLSREVEPGDGQWELERWTSSDGGATFEHTSVTANSAFKNVRPVIPWGPAGPVKVLWMAGTYINFTPTLYHTTLRELTSGLAPIIARISRSAVSVVRGAQVTIGARVVQGIGGDNVPGLPVQLIATTNGVSTAEQHAVADSSGLVQFVVRPASDTSYRVEVPAYGPWSATTSAEMPVHVVQPQRLDITAAPARITLGRSTVITGIQRNAVSGTRTAHAHFYLRHRNANGTWTTQAALAADAAGLAAIRVAPRTTTVYELVYNGSAVNTPATSRALAVVVVRSPAPHKTAPGGARTAQ